MEKRYDHQKWESKIYSLWEESGAFKAKVDKSKKPYTILLPPPNASGKMHIGNVLMIAIEDLLIRWKRMQGFSTLWTPGTDHAGFETQITFERELRKNGKSRMDFDRQSLYKNIWDFVIENRELINDQIKQMGASVDWDKYTFMLDNKVIKIVTDTFKKLHKDKLVYRDDYMVNYCPNCGTTFADLEVKHIKRKDPLVYVKFPISDNKKFKGKDHVVVATVRPETIFVDTHLAINPKDKHKRQLLSFKFQNPLTGKKMEIIEDEFVDMEFGTGVVKITPAHDKNDFEVAKKHGLKIISLLNLDGRLNEKSEDLEGQKVINAREKTIDILKQKGLVEKIDEDYQHTVSVCYKGGHDIEPTILPNWFIKVDPLKKPAHEVVKKGQVKIYPKWQEKKYHKWMKDMHDWPISRQVVWGIRIPAWYDVDENKNLKITFLSKQKETITGTVGNLLKEYSLAEIEKGLQTLLAPKGAVYKISTEKPGERYLQETDTFDTWFSSGQWPLTTLGYPDSKDFQYFYPTDVLETGWEILPFWVSRMLMFGIYLTGKAPFKDIYLHGLVRAMDGRKMSKSLGNVISPDEYLEKYGADALRVGLISGTANGKDFNFPKDKILAYRNFANKIWNMARFMNLMIEESNKNIPIYSKTLESKLKKQDKDIIMSLEKTIKKVNNSLEKYRFAEASETIYHFMWDELASNYLESIKDRNDKEIALSIFRHIYLNSLKLLHPFMPFVTEAIWQNIFKSSDKPLIISSWPSLQTLPNKNINK
ncbi:valine--tRNA ligase [Candidatus Woesebacteria bacterium]|nr:valine--tRNA ligase [Candidatus Woesebacteria bacterium]